MKYSISVLCTDYFTFNIGSMDDDCSCLVLIPLQTETCYLFLSSDCKNKVNGKVWMSRHLLIKSNLDK